MLTTLAAFDPEHVRNLSIHFCLSLASIAKQNKIYTFIKKVWLSNLTLPRNLNISPLPVCTVKVISSSFDGDIQESVNSITPLGPFLCTSSGYNQIIYLIKYFKKIIQVLP